MKMTKEKDGRYYVQMQSWSTFVDTLGRAIQVIIGNQDQI